MLSNSPFFNLKANNNTDYLSQAQAKLLLIFIYTVIILVVLLQFSMLFAGWDDFLKTLVVTPILFTGFIIALLFLKKGRYLISANIAISFATFVVVLGLIREPFYSPDVAFVSYIFFVFPVIGMCMIFSNKRFLTIITGVFIITDIIVFLILRNVVNYSNIRQITLGLTDSIFSLIFLYVIAFLASRIFRRSIEISKEEAQKNLKNSTFIHNLLKEVTEKIVIFIQNMSGKSNQVLQSNQDQAAAIEQVTATIEEISAGVDNVASNVSYQNQSIITTSYIIDDLRQTIDAMGNSINDFLNTTADISLKAKSGEKSLSIMGQNIEKIKERSKEMVNIVGIINDISDKINLLSLNAAIEAARAGDAGRGFAVVADEVSKLADITANSIKNIQALIKTNENEIDKGLSETQSAVQTIITIIKGVNSINEKIKKLSEDKEKQNRLGSLVDKQSKELKDKSQIIASSADEQRKAVAEIINSISHINEISQSNSQGAEDMSQDTSKLMKLIDELKTSLEDYSKKELNPLNKQ